MPSLWTLRHCDRWLKPLQYVCNLNARPAPVVKRLVSRVQYQTCTHRESSKFCSVSFKVWPSIFCLGRSLKEIDSSTVYRRADTSAAQCLDTGSLRLIIQNVWRKKCNMIRKQNIDEKEWSKSNLCAFNENKRRTTSDQQNANGNF